MVEEERIPFTVKIVRSEEDLRKAVVVRYEAYARHLPSVAALLQKPEINDYEKGSIILLAESKVDGSPLGTMRIQTNRYRRLAVEQSVSLPEWLQEKRLVEVTRLGVSGGRTGRIVKAMLLKACFQYCLLANVENMIIAARSPLDRQYEALLFEDLLSHRFIPMSHAGNIPHRVLALDVSTAIARWVNANHPMLKFMLNTHHPDIDLDVDSSIAFLQQTVRPEEALDQPNPVQEE